MKKSSYLCAWTIIALNPTMSQLDEFFHDIRQGNPHSLSKTESLTKWRSNTKRTSGDRNSPKHIEGVYLTLCLRLLVSNKSQNHSLELSNGRCPGVTISLMRRLCEHWLYLLCTMKLFTYPRMEVMTHIGVDYSVVCSTIMGIVGALGSGMDNKMVSTLFYVH